MFNFCKYRNFFGEIGQGVHSYRVFNIAIVDVVCTLIGAKVIQYFFFPKKAFIVILFILFLLGIFFHRLFCVKTTIDKILFGN
jgi:hypothetical protein